MLACTTIIFQRDVSKDTPDTPVDGDESAPPTPITFKDLTEPAKLVMKEGELGRPPHSRRRRESVPTPSPELASTTPLVIRGGTDQEVQPPTPSEELASTTPLMIRDGNPDQWQRRLKRSDEEPRMPPTVALQADPDMTEVEESTETSPEPQRPQFPRQRRVVQETIPDLGMPIPKENARKEGDFVRSPPSNGEKLEDLGKPIPKVPLTYELPKTEDESGWSRPRRSVDTKAAQEGQGATVAEQKEVELPDTPSTAPLTTDRLQVEAQTPELTKEEASEPTEATRSASENEQEAVETPEKPTPLPLVMDRVADVEVEYITTEKPKRDFTMDARRRRSPQMSLDDESETTTASLSGQEQEQLTTTKQPPTPSKDHDDSRIEEIERVLAGGKVKSKEEKSERRKRSSGNGEQGRKSVYHKKPGVAGVEEAGLVATLEEQTAHALAHDNNKEESTREQKQAVDEEKNDRRRRQSTSTDDAIDVPEVQKKDKDSATAGSELETRTRGVGDRTEAGSDEKTEDAQEEEKKTETTTASRYRRSTGEEEQEGRGEAGPAGSMSAGRISAEGDSQNADEGMQGKDVKKRSATFDQMKADGAPHGTPDTSGTGFHETDCRGRVFC